MKKFFWLLVCLLLALGLAGCSGDNNQRQADSVLLEELKIAQGDIDQTLKSLQYNNPGGTAAQAMIVELQRRVLILEAERQDLLPDKEAVRQRVIENYEVISKSAAEPEEDVHGSEEAWAYLQGFIAHLGLTEEEYLEMAAEVAWGVDAGIAVREAFTATLTPEQQADEWETMLAWNKHLNALLLELGPQLLEEDVRLLGEDYLAIVEAEQAVFEGDNGAE